MGSAGPEGDLQSVGTQVADEDGNVTFEWEVPDEAELGTHTFELTADRYVDNSAEFEVVTQPVIEASPNYVEPGDQVMVTGSDFLPESTVAVVYTDSSGSEVDSFEGVEVGEDGGFEHTLDVPADVVLGELSVVATDEDEAVDLSASDSVTVVDGSIGVSPDEVEPGESVTVEGEGFGPGETVTVVFEHGDGSTWTETADADDDGGFTLTWPVPGDVELGDLDVTATGEDSGTSASDTVEVSAITDVGIAVEHDVVPQGGGQIGYGSGYAPGTEVVGSAGPEGDLQSVGAQVADEDGNVTFEWDIPADADVGTHVFALVADRYIDQEVDFEVVVEPAVIASPGFVEPGGEVSVEGSDFLPGSTVTVVYTDSGGQSWPRGGVEVGPEGTFTDTFEVPGDAGIGELIVDVTDDEAPFNASDSVTVVDGSIVVSPDEVEPGESVSVVGDGFAPGETVTVVFEHGDGSTWTETADADDDGGFTLTWPVPGDAELGDLDVTATGEDSGTSDSETVEVVAITGVDISVEYEVVPLGGQQVGYGSGYAPGTEVTGTAGPGDDWVDLGAQVDDEDGNVTFACDVPGDAVLGTHVFTLTADRYVDQSTDF